ncbi:MAG: TIGR00153 family protein [Chlamydiia bacterium]|nr:TIGR00153 family protein [Chlamydiia bacterium]
MLTILNLFGKSPFAPLMHHMELVGRCVELVPELFIHMKAGDATALEKTAAEISRIEHKADLAKNDIRNHLPKTLFLAIDRAHLLEILSLQDSIADTAEDVAVLLTLKELKLIDVFKEDFQPFLMKNLEAYKIAKEVMRELHDLLESSFGGVGAEKVREMVIDISEKEHEADVLQRKLLKKLIDAESELSYTTFYLWTKIFTSIAAISNLSEKLANRVRMTLDLK